MKKITALILCICMVLTLAACSSTAKDPDTTKAPPDGAVDYSSMTIAWSPANLSNELQVTLTDNIKASVEALGAKFLSSDPQGDPVTQVTQVENFISRGVDMILMSPNDASACGVALQEAVGYDRHVPRNGRQLPTFAVRLRRIDMLRLAGLGLGKQFVSAPQPLFEAGNKSYRI